MTDGAYAGMASAEDTSASNHLLLGGALVAWAVAVAIALWAQYQIAPLGNLSLAVQYYAVAALVGGAALSLIDERVPLPGAAREASLDRPPTLHTAARLLIAAGVWAVGFAVVQLGWAAAYESAFVTWLIGLALTAVGFGIATPRSEVARWRLDRRRVFEMAVVLGILAVAVALRLPDLSQIPPEVHGDEAACGLEARRILHGEVRNLFTVGWYQIPNISFAISAAAMAVLGEDLWGFRMASAIQGVLAVLLLYLLAKRLFSARVAALAAFLLAVSHWEIHFSRAGINYVQAQVATLLVLYFLVRGVQRRQPLDWLLAGFASGLSLNVYYAARLAPALGAAYLAHKLITERGFFRRQRANIAVLGIGAVLFMAPMLLVFSQHPHALVSRMEGVFLLTPAGLQHAFTAQNVDNVPAVLRNQIVNTLTAFNWRGETSMQHGHRGDGLIDFWSSALFVIGVVAVTLRAYRSSYFLLAVWFWATLVFGSILTVDAMFSPRVIAAVPVICLFPALVIDGGWRATGRLFGRAGTALFALPVVLFLGLSARANYDDYFNVHIGRMQIAGANTILSRYVAAVNGRFQVYVLGRNSLLYDTERFLIPDVDGVDVREDPLPLPLRRIPAHKGIAFIIDAFWSAAAERRQAIERAYPDGWAETVDTTTGIPMFYAYLVGPAQLAAAIPDPVLEPRPLPALSVAQVQPYGSSPDTAPDAPPSRSSAPWLGLADGSEPRAVAVANGGELFVVDGAAGQVRHFSAAGAPLGAVADGPDGAITDPRAVAVAPDGTVYVLDAERQAVAVIGSNGAVQRSIPIPDADAPGAIAVDRALNLFVADTGRDRIVRIAPNGDAQATRGRVGSLPLRQPASIATGPDDEIFVLDSGNARIVVLGRDLAYHREWKVPLSPASPGAHVLVANDFVLLSQPDRGTILQYDRHGRRLAELGAGALHTPVGLAAAADGNLYVADAGLRGIVRLAQPDADAAEPAAPSS